MYGDFVGAMFGCNFEEAGEGFSGKSVLVIEKEQAWWRSIRLEEVLCHGNLIFLLVEQCDDEE